MSESTPDEQTRLNLLEDKNWFNKWGFRANLVCVTGLWLPFGRFGFRSKIQPCAAGRAMAALSWRATR